MDDHDALRHLHTGRDYQALATSTADPNVLRALAASSLPFVWQAIAANPAAPTDLLADLAGRRNTAWNDNYLFLLLARHPAATGPALQHLLDSLTGHLMAGCRPYAAVLALAARRDSDVLAAGDRIAALGTLPGASARLRRGLARTLPGPSRTAAGTGE